VWRIRRTPGENEETYNSYEINTIMLAGFWKARLGRQGKA
jgi:hypothetical protein